MKDYEFDVEWDSIWSGSFADMPTSELKYQLGRAQWNYNMCRNKIAPAFQGKDKDEYRACKKELLRLSSILRTFELRLNNRLQANSHLEYYLDVSVPKHCRTDII